MPVWSVRVEREFRTALLAEAQPVRQGLDHTFVNPASWASSTLALLSTSCRRLWRRLRAAVTRRAPSADKDMSRLRLLSCPVSTISYPAPTNSLNMVLTDGSE